MKFSILFMISIAAVFGAAAEAVPVDADATTPTDYATLEKSALNGDDAALRNIQAAADSGNADAEYRLGDYYYTKQQYDQAGPWLEEATDQWISQGDFKEAINCSSHAIDAYLNNKQSTQAAEMYVKLGDLYYESPDKTPVDLGSAGTAWQRAVELDPSLPGVQARLMNFYNDLAHQNSADWPKAAAAAAQVLNQDPKNARAYGIEAAAIISIMESSGNVSTEGFTQAAGDLTKAAQLDPANADYPMLLAQVYQLQAKAELSAETIDAEQNLALQNAALAAVQKFAQSNPNNPQGWLNLATISSAFPNMQANVEDALNRAAALAPNNPNIIVAQLNELVSEKADPKQIGNAFDRLIAIQPDRITNYLYAGEYYAGIGSYLDAAKYLNAALKHSTSDDGMTPAQNDAMCESINKLQANVYLNLVEATPAGTAQRNDYLNHASDAIKAVRQREPDSPWVDVYEGRLAAGRKEYESALEQLKAAEILLSPTSTDSGLVDLWIQDKSLQAQIYAAEGENGVAMNELDEVDQFFPNQPSVELGIAQLELERDPAAASNTADSVLNQNPGDLQAQAIKAQALAQLGQTAELETFLDATGSKTLPLALIKARLELMNENFAEAWQTLQPWVKLYPADPDVVIPGYAALAGINDRADAAQLISEAVKLAPDNTQFIMLNDQLAKPDKPLEQLTFQSLTSDVTSVSMNAENANQSTVMAVGQTPATAKKYLQQANDYIEDGQIDLAEGALKKAIIEAPDDPEPAQRLATLYLQQNNMVAAQDVYAQLSESSNTQSAFIGRLLLGDLYQASGSLVQAAQMYLQAQNVMPTKKAVVENRMGDMYFENGDYADALEYYTPLYALNSQDHGVALRYAETLIHAGQIDAGLKIIDEHLLEQNPVDEQALAVKGMALSMEQRFPEALDVLNKALALNPNDEQALYSRATVYVGLEPPEYQQAIDDLSLIESIDSKDFPTRELLARIYSQNNRYAEAVHEYQRAIALKPDDQGVRLNFAELLIVLADKLANISPDDNSDAAASLRIINPGELLEDLVRDSLHYKVTNIEYAQWLALQGQYDMHTGNADAGIGLTQKAYEMSGRTPAAALAYLRVLLDGERYAQAIDVANQAIAVSPGDYEFYEFRGRALALLNRFSESHADFIKALNLSLDDPKQFFSVLDLYQQASNDAAWLPDVFEHLRAMQSQHQDMAALFYTSLASTKYANKDNRATLLLAATALASDPVGITEINALRMAAQASNNLDEIDQAKTYYQRLLEVAPDDPSACNNLAYLLAVQFNDPRDALPYAIKANTILVRQDGLSGYSHDSNDLDTLGWIYYLNGDIPDAHDALETCMLYNPPPAAFYHLGQVLIAQQNISEARDVLQKGLDAARRVGDPVGDQIESLLNSDALNGAN
jgi:tetratricopeptide (TPR) repeat protein